METEVRVTNSMELSRINEVIHDHWFDVDDVMFNEATATLEIRFTRPPLEAVAPASERWLLRRVDIPYVESFLRIHYVRNWVLEDTERVGSYDFNELRFHEGLQRVEVTTAVPLRLYSDVERLEVSVIVTGHVVSTKRKFALFS